MFRPTARRLVAAAVAAAAVLVIVIVTAASVASQPDPHGTLYRNFCPLKQADVAAAGPYSPSTHSEPTSSRP